MLRHSLNTTRWFYQDHSWCALFVTAPVPGHTVEASVASTSDASIRRVKHPLPYANTQVRLVALREKRWVGIREEKKMPRDYSWPRRGKKSSALEVGSDQGKSAIKKEVQRANTQTPILSPARGSTREAGPVPKVAPSTVGTRRSHVFLGESPHHVPRVLEIATSNTGRTPERTRTTETCGCVRPHLSALATGHKHLIA